MPIEHLIFGGLVGLAAVVVAVVAYRNRPLPTYENQQAQYNNSDQQDNNQTAAPVFRRITYSRNDRLRLTNNTASIYKGKFEEKIDVALKRVKICRNDAVQIDTDLASLLKRSRLVNGVNHDIIREGSVTNIVKYFCYEFEIGENTLHLLLALELCDCNLEEYIQSRHDYPLISNKEIISQILFGLQYLHSRHIVHGNLKPSNILLQHRSDDELLFKLSDFGLLKLHGQTENGTVDWLAPEIYDMRRPGLLDLERSFWQRSDIFPLGLIFYFIVTDGHYVFRSQDDIQREKADYTHVVSNRPFLNLLTRMLKPKPDDRPFTEDIWKHPALWSSEKILDFFYYASNLLMEPSISRTCTIDNNSVNVLRGGNWRVHLTYPIKNYLFSSPAVHNRRNRNQIQPHYDETSVQSLLRAIRNNDIKGQYHQLQSVIQTEFGNYPDGYLEYWTSKFPDLLIHVYDEMQVYRSDLCMLTFYA